MWKPSPHLRWPPSRFARPKSTSTSEAVSRVTNIIQHDRPLRQEVHEIRLLRILPAQYISRPLRCSLLYVSLDDNPVFQALSYTWGSPFSEKETSRPVPVMGESKLYISGVPVDITDNLNSALRYCRPKDVEMILWVDAVCINQQDSFEKTWQVQQMRMVYEKAVSTIIWLGPPADGSDTAIETLCAMRRFTIRAAQYRQPGTPVVSMWGIPAEKTQEGFLDQVIAASFGRLFQKPIFCNMIEIPPFPIKEVVALFERGWWSRVWVLQELVLARRVIFACGSQRIDIEDADEVFNSFQVTWDQQVTELGRPAQMLDHRPWTMIDTRVRFKQKRKFLPLKHLLEEASLACLRASNQLDYIYGLLGLAGDGPELGIEVDYTITFQTLFTKVAKAYLKRGTLWFLSYCTYDPDETPGLPTWVPNWSIEHGRETFSKMAPFKACKDTTTSFYFPIQANSLLPPRIVLRGIIMDKIDYVSDVHPPFYPVNIHPNDRKTILSWLRLTSNSLLRAPDPTSAHGNPNDACWTFVARNITLRSADNQLSQQDQADAIFSTYNYLINTEWDDLETASDTQTRHRADCYFAFMMSVTDRRRVFRTEKAFMGLGSRSMRVEDRLVVFLGGRVPIILRKQQSGCYRLVGEAWVNDMMWGEAFNGKEDVVDIELE